MYVTAIVLAAGKGARLKNKISKPLIVLNSKPVIVYSLETLNNLPFIKDIIVVVNTANRTGIIKTIRGFDIQKVRRVVTGGRRRQDSLGRGLRCIDRRTDIVLIHDAARPFADKKSITAAVKAAAGYGASVVGMPVKATIKKVVGQPQGLPFPKGRESIALLANTGLSDKAGCSRLSVGRKNIVRETLNREELWEIQTPQAFKKELIVRAFEKFGGMDVTDDAMLVEKLGARVCVVPGSYSNIKITTPEDLIIAEALLKRAPGAKPKA